MLNKNVEVFMGCDTGWHVASTVLFGAPFDGTTSYRPGTRFGSSAIRHESYGIESYSPYQDLDLFDGDVTDIGDIELPFGSSDGCTGCRSPIRPDASCTPTNARSCWAANTW